MVIGLIVAAITVAVIGGTAAWQWGEAKKVEAAGKAKASIITADELEKWVPWAIMGTVAIVCVAVIAWYWIKYTNAGKKGKAATVGPPGAV
jgi:hypothetical protein